MPSAKPDVADLLAGLASPRRTDMSDPTTEELVSALLLAHRSQIGFTDALYAAETRLQELRAEVQSWADVAQKFSGENTNLRAEVERLTAERDDLSERFGNQAASILRLYDLADQLAEALRKAWFQNGVATHPPSLAAWEAAREPGSSS